MSNITNKILQGKAGLSYNGLMYRIKNIEASGQVIEEHYGRGGIRQYTEEEAEIIVNWKGEKRGRKRKDD